MLSARRSTGRLHAIGMGHKALLAVLSVLVLVGAIVVHEWRQRGPRWYASSPTLEDFRQAHPQLEVLPLVESPTGRSPDNLLWMLRSRADARQAIVRRDFVLGRQVNFAVCPADLPLPPDATGAVCFRTSAVDGLAGALWASFQTDDAGEAAAERVAAFYADQSSRARRGQLHPHRLQADRWCVGLSDDQ